MKTSREQFEYEMCNEYSWFGEALEVAQFHGDDATGYYTGGDFIYHGKSCADALFWAWRGWQASRQCIEVEPPELLTTPVKQFEFERDCQWKEAISKAGIKVKGA